MMPERDRQIYRQCPACGVVRAAAAIKRAPGVGRFGVPVQSRCANCGHVALRADFPLTDPPAEGGDGGGALPNEPGAKS
jgi:hypothetical protein